MGELHGIIPPIITPILDNEDVDEQSLRTVINRCLEGGLHGIFVAGSGGESLALTQEQRDRAIRVALDEGGGRIPVLCGVMDTSTRKVIENVKRLEQYGAEYVVVSPVFYTKTTCQADIVRHYEEISRQTAASVIIYNIPTNTSINILPETVEKLVSIDRVKGLKDSSGNWVQFQKILFRRRQQTDFSLFQGVTESAGISLLAGADGFIPIYSIFFPRIYQLLYACSRQRDIEGVLFFQKLANYISDQLTIRGHTTIGAKAIAAQFGCGSPLLCNPSVAISGEEHSLLRQRARRYDEVIRSTASFDYASSCEELLGPEQPTVKIS